MLTREQAQEFLRDLQLLPDDKIASVRDYVSFLKERFGRRSAFDTDAWSAEDVSNLTRAILGQAEPSKQVPPRNP